MRTMKHPHENMVSIAMFEDDTGARHFVFEIIERPLHELRGEPRKAVGYETWTHRFSQDDAPYKDGVSHPDKAAAVAEWLTRAGLAGH